MSESYAQGITDNGSIVGYGDLNGVQTAILWSSVFVEIGVPGDYNNNGKVDGADYIMWRNGTNPLPNEVSSIGTNDTADYTAWRARFGNTVGSAVGNAQPSAIPEPTSTALVILGLAFGSCVRVCRRWSHLRFAVLNSGPGIWDSETALPLNIRHRPNHTMPSACTRMF